MNITFHTITPGTSFCAILEHARPATIAGRVDPTTVYIFRPKYGADRIAIETCPELDDKLATFTGRLVTVSRPAQPSLHMQTNGFAYTVHAGDTRPRTRQRR